MPLNPGELLAAAVARIPASAGRRQRRHWAGNGRAHIEVKGVHRPENSRVARRLELALARLDGVDWAEVNAVAGRVIVAFDDQQVDVADLVDVVEGVEEAHDLAGERFPHERPEHPGDIEPLERQAWAIGADIGGLGLSLVGRLARANPLLGEAASLISLADATPVLRRALESRLGRTATDLGLAAGNAVAQGLSQGPLGLVVDIAHRGLLLDELRARRDAWQRREPLLHGARTASGPLAAIAAGRPRPAPLPSGPIESYSSGAAAGALLAAAGTAAASRDPHLVVAATATANPRAARLGREGFAARLDRDLARSGALTMDAEALRRLDRIDAVVLDARVLTTGRMVVGSVWLPPGQRAEADAALLAANALAGAPGWGQQAAVVPAARRGADDPLGGDPPAGDPPGDGDTPWSGPLAVQNRVAATATRGPWAVGPVPRVLTGPVRAAARDLRARGRQLLGLWRDGELAGLAILESELDPLAVPLIAAARPVGLVAMAGRARIGTRAGADRVLPGGTRLAASVRELQAEGRAVALVSAHQHEALAAADLGIGVPAGQRPPWGAHVITNPGLADACHILRAVPAARAVSRRAATLAAYGSGAGAVLALAGPRPGAAARSLIGVHGAALASAGSGVWSAMTLARRPPPLPAETTGWHALEPEAALARLGSSEAGLAGDEAARRLASLPELREEAEPGLLRTSAEELANPLTPALASGAGLAAAAGSITDAALIGTFVTANALVSGIQRVSVGHALRRLIDESAVRVRLRRGGEEEQATAATLVPGDVIVVQAGDAVPADCRLLEARGLEVDESSLTGESQLVRKDAAPTGAAEVAGRTSMLYAGSSVAAGAGSAVVVATGEATELGRSSRLPEGETRRTGVQARLRKLTSATVPLVLGAGAAVIAGGLLRGRPLRDTLGTGVSLAVAAVPEGLPVVATAAQYSAARRLSRRNALVRNPGTIEALGRVDVLCFDKTGTLTQGRIRLHRVWASGAECALGALTPDGALALAAALRATPGHADGESLAHATDQAVAEGAADAGVGVEAGAGRWRLTGELPFEPSRGYHAVLGRTSAGHLLTVKGAPETVLPLCSRHRPDGAEADLGERSRRAISGQVDALARRGYRVLAVAERDASGRRDLREDRVERLCFRGLLALADPARETAAQAVSGLRAAHVEVMMLTGDHPSTAAAIAAELDLLDSRRVITGPEIDGLSDHEMDEIVGQAAVFARVSPEHKVRIVAALRRCGRVVAVTGDGANDAPAIRLADVGVALGRRGTNAAKEAADVVVTDDRIETITDAIVEGRAMWSSVRDAIAMLLGGNLGESAFTIGTGFALPGGSPLGARQLLLVNLLTDMVPSLALAVRQPQATPAELLREGPDVSLGTALTRDIVVRGALTAGSGLAAWLGGRLTGVTPRRASTIALVGIVGAQLSQTLVAGWRSPLVVAAGLGSAAALAAVIQTPGVSHFFGCRPLGPVGWGVGLSAAAAAGLGAPLASRVAARIG